ncbi:MAG: carboxylating nicotinate-nucleotide diphosphorylase [Candidatus Aminicenantes bacterium]|nr:carboxylating nicotinate-nucleotide diphosphorylase [Candidatus Aminicenantes bacterium]
MDKDRLDFLIDMALREDMPNGDITSESVISDVSTSKAVILAKEDGVLAGIDIAETVFRTIDPSLNFHKLKNDGNMISAGQKLARIEGNSISLLKGERTALNFLQRLSGIASMTHKFVDSLTGTRTQILDTRKTTPGLRELEKYAVRMGGGKNHRMSLSDMVLIKDNHLQLVGSISEAVTRARKKVGNKMKIEVETTSIEEVKEALETGADLIMLDNMSIEAMKEVVEFIQGRVPLEVSGKVDLNRIKELASLGVDYISVGGLTHSYHSLDISLEFMA